MTTNVSKSLHERLSTKLAQVPRSGIRDFFDIVSTRDDIISLSIGEPDFDTPWHVREATVFALERGGSSTCYTSNMGMLKLRKQLSAYVKNTFGADYQPETEVLVTVGVSEAMDLAIRAITNPGDEILYHEPAFVSYAPVVTFSGGVPVAVQTSHEEQFVLTRDALEAHVSPKTKALILNYPNNPTGAVLNKEQLEDIAAFAVAHDILVITDEIYAELSYDNPHTSIVSLPGMRERTIFLHGFSKAWAMTGFRMGYICAPAVLTEAMMKIHQYIMMSAPTPSQEAAYEALRNPACDVEEMRSSYMKRRNFIVSRFDDMGLPYAYPSGAFYAFPYVADYDLTSKEFALRFLEEEKVAVVPGSAFGTCGEGYVRCAYATALDDLKTAMDRLENFLKKLK